MSNEHVYDTNSGPILEAITSGKTVIVFLFSYLEKPFLNIHAVLPSLEEASAIYNISSNQPDWDWDLETAMINKYVPIPLERDWLLRQAPAGLASSLCESLLNCALPTDPDEVQTLLNITRGNQLLYDQFKSLIVQAGGTHQDVKNCDVFQLLRYAIASEANLVGQGILEHGFTIVQKEGGYSGGSSHMKGYGVIDTESANAELSKQLRQ
jgi:hypothetical protein